MFKRPNSLALHQIYKKERHSFMNFISISPKYRLREGSGAEFASENLNRVNVIGTRWVFLDVFVYYKGTFGTPRFGTFVLAEPHIF